MKIKNTMMITMTTKNYGNDDANNDNKNLVMIIPWPCVCCVGITARPCTRGGLPATTLMLDDTTSQ